MFRSLRKSLPLLSLAVLAILLLSMVVIAPASVRPARAVRTSGDGVGEAEESRTITPAPTTLASQLRDQHLTRIGVDRWHTAGYRGKGVKVAVLDTGFRGYHNFLGKTLPDRV